MPTRSRTHQLEDESIIFFQGLLPTEWVVRRKEQDYGVDLEVELFEPSGIAIGLIFYVQMRATDDRNKASKLVIKREQVDYLNTLPTSTIFVRYCSSTKEIFYQWHFSIMAATCLSDDQKTFTYKFSVNELWSASSTNSIRETLELIRTIRSYPTYLPVCLNVTSNGLKSVEQKYIIDQIISDLSECEAISFNNFHNAVFDIFISINTLELRLNQLSSIKIITSKLIRDEAVVSILYCIVALLQIHRLPVQASRVSKHILKLSASHHSRFLALQACIALDFDLRASTKLAIINEIHAVHDEFYASYLNFLLISHYNEADRDEIVLNFYDCAIEKAQDNGPLTEATVFYSKGNYQRFRGNYMQAVRSFNKARKLYVDYLTRDYFLRELGSCLFNTAHYKCAAEAYRRAMGKKADHRDVLYFADALFLSGNLIEAKLCYEHASQSDELSLICESNLKSRLCNWLLQLIGSEKVPTRKGEAELYLQVNGVKNINVLRHVIANLNALDELAHFNLGIGHANEGLYQEAIWSFLFVAFKASGDMESWANAIVCAIKINSPDTVLAILTVCFSLTGTKSYHDLREIMVKHMRLDSPSLEILDEIFRGIKLESGHFNNMGPPIMRNLGELNFDISLQIDNKKS